MRRQLILGITTCLFGIAANVGGVGAANVSQVSGGTGPCPTGGQSKLVTGEVSLETSGQPVLMMYNLEISASPTGGIFLVPVIDGTADGDGQLDRLIGAASGQVDVISFSRAYWLNKGIHTFAVIGTCQSAVNVTRSWLTVYELSKH